jgi:hypothetical protein
MAVSQFPFPYSGDGWILFLLVQSFFLIRQRGWGCENNIFLDLETHSQIFPF